MDLFYKRFTKRPQIGLEAWKITNDPNVLEFHDMGTGIINPSTIIGYMVFVDQIDMILGFLLKFSKINSNGNWIFIFNTMSYNEVEFVFEQAWLKLKMLNILGITVIGNNLLSNCKLSGIW